MDPDWTPPPRPPNINAPVPGLSDAELARLPFNPTGEYRRADPKGRMRVRSRDDGWELYVWAEAFDRGSATPSPCTLAAVGPLKGRTIVGKLVAFEDDAGASLYQFAADGSVGNITVEFRNGAAEVTDNASFGICGLHSDLSGHYVRR